MTTFIGIGEIDGEDNVHILGISRI